MIRSSLLRRLALIGSLAWLPFAVAPCVAGQIAPERVGRVADAIESFASEHDFQGSISLLHAGEVIFQTSNGVIALGSDELHTPDTPTPIASITKLFTATLILKLHEQGRLNLDTPIGRYLPGYEGEIGSTATLHHLLTHTSGIRNADSMGGKVNGVADLYVNELTTDQIIKRYCAGPADFPVGTNWDYNNGDFILLGKIVENVSGEPYEDLLQRLILDPLGMGRTGMIGSVDTPRLAEGIRLDDPEVGKTGDTFRRLQNYDASGGMYSTNNDLALFAEGLYGGELLSDDSLKIMLRTYPESQSYGYGQWIRFFRYDKHVARVAQRFGRIGAINTLLAHFIDDDLTLVIVSNCNWAYVSDVQHVVAEQLFEGADDR